MKTLSARRAPRRCPSGAPPRSRSLGQAGFGPQEDGVRSPEEQDPRADGDGSTGSSWLPTDPAPPIRPDPAPGRSVSGPPNRLTSGAASGPLMARAAVWGCVKSQPPDLPSHDMTGAAGGAAYGTP